MKCYVIHFRGFFPVGACAIVFADCEEAAVNTLWGSEEFYPHRQRNKIADLLLTTNELTQDKSVNILVNGDY